MKQALWKNEKVFAWSNSGTPDYIPQRGQIKCETNIIVKLRAQAGITNKLKPLSEEEKCTDRRKSKKIMETTIQNMEHETENKQTGGLIYMYGVLGVFFRLWMVLLSWRGVHNIKIIFKSGTTIKSVIFFCSH